MMCLTILRAVFGERLHNHYYARCGRGSSSHLAASIAPLMDDPWKSMDIRKIKAKNFFVYYRIDETNNRVYVLAVVDQKRNQMEVLEKKFPHDD